MIPHRPHPVRVLVTGAAGFLGSHAVDLLLDEGHVVLGIDDLSSGRRAHLASARSRGFRLVDDDLLHRGLLNGVVDAFRPEVILHAAGFGGVTKAEQWPGHNRRLHVEATRVVVEAARSRGIGRVVLVSSAAVAGEWGGAGAPDPGTELGRAKLESERLLADLARSGGTTAVAARLSHVYGGRQDPAAPQSSVVTVFAERFRKRRPVTIFGDGTRTRDLLWIADAARGLALAATRPGVPSGAYALCSGTAHSVAEIAGRFAALNPGAPDPVFAPERGVDFSQGAGDPSAALEFLGFSASVGLDEGIRELMGCAGEALRRAA